MELLHQLGEQLVSLVANWGLIGVFVLMFVESSLFPLPSEIVMIPAGIAASQGRMNLAAAIVAGTVGSLAGAYFNYYLAVWLGRPFLERYGRYLFLPPEKFARACAFFERHGSFGTFLCRLIPGIRQLISIPAGLARMPHLTFSLYTTSGAGIWVAFLAITGYWIGDNQEQAEAYVKASVPYIVVGAVLLVVIYIAVHFRRNSDEAVVEDAEPIAETAKATQINEEKSTGLDP